VFKPALRRDAAERAVRRMLATIAPNSHVDVVVEPHPEHGTVIRVRLSGGADREAATARVKAKLDPLTMRHTIEWTDA
jgi:hypothetical protein